MSLTSPASSMTDVSPNKSKKQEPSKHDTKKKLERWEKLPDRKIECDNSTKEYPKNAISTSKYNAATFVPKNLFEQFSKAANCYFLILSILQFIPPISISNGVPTILFPLSVIVFISAMKSLFEDLKRHKSDAQENNSSCEIYSSHGFEKKKWKDILVGNIVKVNKGTFFPCDLLFVYSSDPKGICYIETKSLDGETNLKTKKVHEDVKSCIPSENDLSKIHHQNLSYEKPNPFLGTFKGSLQINGTSCSMSEQNFILRGCSLQNTDFVIGVCCYSGHDTKVMLNSIKAKPKKSHLEFEMSKEVIIIFGVLILFCFFSGLYNTIFLGINNKYLEYLGYTKMPNAFVNFIYRMGNWILIFGNFVPISLLVTLEMVSFASSFFISSDKKLYSEYTKSSVGVQTSNLIDELGQIHYVFSDKTGTLTRNQMIFKKCIVNGRAFGDNADENMNLAALKPCNNVYFKDPEFFQELKSGNDTSKKINEFLKFLSICHGVQAEKQKDGSLVYNASSPDELALVSFAKYLNYEFVGCDENGLYLVDINNTISKFKILYTLEFNSTRKRMSIITEEFNKYFLYTKGADNIVGKRLNNDEKDVKDKSWAELDRFAKEGLRTLIYGKKEISKTEFTEWKSKYDAALNLIEGRDTKVDELQDEIEKNLTFIGASAIEDRLQDEVAETIYQMKMAGIKVWVLTGDKIETAKTIGFSCNLLQENMKIFDIDKLVQEEIHQQMIGISESLKHMGKDAKNIKKALVVSGDSLTFIYYNNALKVLLLDLAAHCEAVLCCRVSPKQKQEIVFMVKQKYKKLVTLAIGDGANDVNMITEAHVGLGIKGLEGSQAARSSDFAIGEFKHMRRLLFYYGRESYRRNSNLVLFSFYKNILIVLPQFWYGFFNFFSGQTLYDSFLYQFYNVLFAAAPIILYALFDHDSTDEILENSPQYYSPGPDFKWFNYKRFWGWFTAGTIHAILVAFILYGIDMNFHESEGDFYSFWPYGMMVFQAAVILSNLKIIVFTNTYNILIIIVLIGSFLLYFLCNIYVSVVQGNNVWTFMKLYGGVTHYLATLIIAFIGCGIDIAIDRIFNFGPYAHLVPPLNKKHSKKSRGIKIADESELDGSKTEIKTNHFPDDEAMKIHNLEQDDG